MIDFTKPLQTRYGCPVRIIASDVKSDYTVVGVITQADGTESVRLWLPDGRAYVGGGTGFDLVNAPVMRTGWMNIYTFDGSSGAMAVLHPTRELADEIATADRVACIPVSFEEGDGL